MKLISDVILKENYEIQLDEDRKEVAEDLILKFLTKDSDHFVDINEEIIERCKANLAAASKDLFFECAQ